MGKLTLVLFFLLSFNSYCFSVENIFQDDLTLTDSLSITQSSTSKQASIEMLHGKYLSDPKNRISKDFDIPKKLRDRVEFWYRVYTQYESYNSVIHDIESLGIIYDVIDFSDFQKSGLNKNTRYSLQNKALKGIVQNYKNAFKKLSVGKCNSQKCKQILSALKKNKIRIPQNKKKRKRLFTNLSRNLRTQTGQKDHILKGLDNLKGYQETIELLFKEFEMPNELLAISFLESSFNIHAKSKVGATGPWQFMRIIGKHFFVQNRFVDQRKSAVISTSGALHLLKQNIQIMDRWDLAVNAYNSGTGLLRRGVRSLKKKGFTNPGVSELIDHFKHPNWGFAAKNFYSEFLALVYTLAYKSEIYSKKFDEHDGLIDIYVTKCRIPLLKLLPGLKSTKHNIMALNNHLSRRYRKSSFPKGTVVLSDVELTERKYYKVPHAKLRRRYPKNLHKFVRNQSCSKR